MNAKHNHSNLTECLFSISQITVQTPLWKPGLDEIVSLAHKTTPFDYVLIHQIDSNDQNQIIYAKSFLEQELQVTEFTWKETLADQVIKERRTILQQEKSQSPSKQDACFLGIPLVTSAQSLGGMTYIRTHGPIITDDEVRFFEFIAQQASILIERQILRLEHELLETQRQQAQRQQDFITLIAHELRNPLGCIKGYTTTLLRPDVKFDEESQNEFLQIIDQETDRLQELITNMVESARLQSGQLDMDFQIMRVETLINTIISETRKHDPNLIIHLTIDSTLSTVVGDQRRLKQVFEHIISNAQKHAPNSDISITIKQDSVGVHTLIEDQGPGIPEQYLPNLFDRFFRVPEKAPNIPGSGLGLYICKQIMQAHRGEISVSSRLGEGTTFHLIIPYKI
jgi:signal transduction histidine kinase